MLLCSKLKPSAEDIKAITALVSKSFDWDRFIILIKEHRLFPPVYETLKNHLKDNVPTEVYKRVEALRKKNLHKCITNIAAAVKVSRLLNENGIDHLFLKGFCLSQILYGHPCSRYAGDIDLIVDENIFEYATHLLENKGFTQAQSETELTSENKALFLESTHHIAYCCPTTGARIEVHFRFDKFSSYYPMNFAEAWKQGQYVNINGVDLPTLGDHHTLIYLTLHGSKHFWKRLFWLKDISDYFKICKSRDEQIFFEDMDMMNLSRPSGEMLNFLSIFFGNNLPGKARQTIKADWVLRIGPLMIGVVINNPNGPWAIVFHHLHRIFIHRGIQFKLQSIKLIISVKYHKKTFNPGKKSQILTALLKAKHVQNKQINL